MQVDAAGRFVVDPARNGVRAAECTPASFNQYIEAVFDYYGCASTRWVTLRARWVTR
jgi:hypothetical protein